MQFVRRGNLNLLYRKYGWYRGSSVPVGIGEPFIIKRKENRE